MLTIIGDVHGYHDTYLNIATRCEGTVQVGDFGFDYAVMNGMDPDMHRIIGGNHDNYDIIGEVPHYLGNYGTTNVAGVDFFFVRGEQSVDAHLRIEGRNWWRNEELDMGTGYAALEAYAAARPDIVITHGCPASIMGSFLTNPAKITPSRTAQLLDAMWQAHQPSLWVFGHHHVSRSVQVEQTTFRCLNELETMAIG